MSVTSTQVAPDAAARNMISPELFERLAERIAHDEHVSVGYAERVMEQALAFLKACALNPGMGLSPSAIVDAGWHAFILHTREYAEFCHRLAGRFIHHTPDESAEEAAASVGTTVAAMRVAGLRVDTELWVPAADCSQCHQGCHDSPRTV